MLRAFWSRQVEFSWVENAAASTIYMHVRTYHLRLNGQQLVVPVLFLSWSSAAGERVIVITTETTLTQLASSDCWLMDGNFAMKYTAYFITCIFFKFYLYFVNCNSTEKNDIGN